MNFMVESLFLITFGLAGVVGYITYSSFYRYKMQKELMNSYRSQVYTIKLEPKKDNELVLNPKIQDLEFPKSLQERYVPYQWK